MKAAAVLVAFLLAGTPAWAQTVADQTVADQAAAASSALQSAIADLQTAERAKDRVAALSETIRAYELGLAALRQALRQAQDRDGNLTRALDAKRTEIAQLLGVLSQIGTETGPLLLLHPDGPLDAVRSGMILSDVTPALQREADALRQDLQELADLRSLQAQANETLINGLGAAQSARTALSQAMSDRTDLPHRFTEDPETLRNLVESADTLDALAAGLSLPDEDDGSAADFGNRKGQLPLPVLGRVIRQAGEVDPSGVQRPGITIATRGQALVTSPTAATIRYRGPLLDYGNVMILEPGLGYLLVVAGCETLYGEVGDVIPAGAPLGLMGGGLAESGTETLQLADETGQRETETLYLELRLGAKPVDPAEWFAGTTPPSTPTGD
jgi:murein hydrolase activator